MPVNPRSALLQALIRGPGYGLDLIERVSKATNQSVKLGQGTVYPLLREMEKDGLLTSYESEPLPERGGRPRIYYKLTAEGADQAMRERDAIVGLFQIAGATS